MNNFIIRLWLRYNHQLRGFVSNSKSDHVGSFSENVSKKEALKLFSPHLQESWCVCVCATVWPNKRKLSPLSLSYFFFSAVTAAALLLVDNLAFVESLSGGGGGGGSEVVVVGLSSSHMEATEAEAAEEKEGRRAVESRDRDHKLSKLSATYSTPSRKLGIRGASSFKSFVTHLMLKINHFLVLLTL